MMPWTDIVAGGALVGLIGLVNQLQSRRIGRMETELRSKVGMEICATHYTELTSKIGESGEDIKLLVAEQKNVGENLARLDERIKSLCSEKTARATP